MIIKHSRLIIKQHGIIKIYRYVGDVSHTVSPEGELLPPHHGERRDDEDGHRRGIPPSGRVPERVWIGSGVSGTCGAGIDFLQLP